MRGDSAGGVHLADIAKRFQCTTQTVRNMLTLATACAEVRAAILSGALASTAGLALCYLAPEDQPAALTAIQKHRLSTHREVAAYIRKLRTGAESLTPSRREIQRLVHGDGITIPVPMHAEAYRALQWVLGEIEIPEWREPKADV